MCLSRQMMKLCATTWCAPGVTAPKSSWGPATAGSSSTAVPALLPAVLQGFSTQGMHRTAQRLQLMDMGILKCHPKVPSCPSVPQLHKASPARPVPAWASGCAADVTLGHISCLIWMLPVSVRKKTILTKKQPKYPPHTPNLTKKPNLNKPKQKQTNNKQKTTQKTHKIPKKSKTKQNPKIHQKKKSPSVNGFTPESNLVTHGLVCLWQKAAVCHWWHLRKIELPARPECCN